MSVFKRANDYETRYTKQPFAIVHSPIHSPNLAPLHDACVANSRIQGAMLALPCSTIHQYGCHWMRLRVSEAADPNKPYPLRRKRASTTHPDTRIKQAKVPRCRNPLTASGYIYYPFARDFCPFFSLSACLDFLGAF